MPPWLQLDKPWLHPGQQEQCIAGGGMAPEKHEVNDGADGIPVTGPNLF